MPTYSEMQTEFNSIIAAYSTPMRIRYFTISGGSAVYDDERVLTKSGSDLWISGIMQPFGDSAADAVLRQQGKILQDDTKIYVIGTIETSGLWRIGIGSPITREYANLPEGQENWDITGSTVYKTLHVRYLPTGSLYGE